MRSAWVIVLAACGGASAPKSSTMPSPEPVATSPTPTTVAVNDPAPPPGRTGGDPCMGGEVTPATTPPGGVEGGELGGVDGQQGGGGVGHGSGNPCGGGMRKRGHGPVVHLPPNASVDGPLDKAIIRRYMKRNINRIQYCYEKELVSHAGLAGTVVAKFVIGVDGLVGASEASGMDTTVATCVADVIKTIEFPKPAGGKVSVTYPFNFSATD